MGQAGGPGICDKISRPCCAAGEFTTRLVHRRLQETSYLDLHGWQELAHLWLEAAGYGTPCSLTGRSHWGGRRSRPRTIRENRIRR